MADWLARLKSVRSVALAWLRRHPMAAALGLVPAALAKPGASRRAAEHALLALDRAGFHDVIIEAAETYGQQPRSAIELLLATDPLEILPARIPAVPEWATQALPSPVLLSDRAHALPADAIAHVCTMLAMSRPDEVYPGIDLVKRACDPISLAEFSWTLFQRWQAAGFPSKESWVLCGLAWLGNDETVRRLSPIIRTWPGEGGHARAVAGLGVLRTIGTDVALMHLHAISQKVKFAGLRKRAVESIGDIAHELGLSPDQLADRLVPDFGLAADGSMTLDYGPRQFIVGFDEQLKPFVTDMGGKRRKALPKPGANDDAVLAPAAYQRFTGLKKDVRAIASDQIRRLEQAMVLQRRWTGAECRRFLVDHPLLWHIVRRLVLARFDAQGTCLGGLRVAEDRTFTDVHDDGCDLDDAALVGIAHPLHLGESRGQWAGILADYEILQPFQQLGREVFTLTDADAAKTSITRFSKVTVPTVKVLGLERRGWRRGAPQDGGIQCWMERPILGGRMAVVNLNPGIPVGIVTEWEHQSIEEVWISNRPEGDWRSDGAVSFGELDPVSASEILRDLDEVVADRA